MLIDVANAMDFRSGVLVWANTDSLAEQIQRAHPQAKVVKAFNTMNVSMMFGQASHPAPHKVFVVGNDESAKRQVKRLLEAFGWERDCIIDHSDITAARGVEGYLLLFFRLLKSLETPKFNINIVKR